MAGTRKELAEALPTLDRVLREGAAALEGEQASLLADAQADANEIATRFRTDALAELGVAHDAIAAMPAEALARATSALDAAAAPAQGLLAGLPASLSTSHAGLKTGLDTGVQVASRNLAAMSQSVGRAIPSGRSLSLGALEADAARLVARCQPMSASQALAAASTEGVSIDTVRRFGAQAHADARRAADAEHPERYMMPEATRAHGELSADVLSQLHGWEYQEAAALLQGDRVQAAIARLRAAREEGTDDEAEVSRALEALSAEELAQLRERSGDDWRLERILEEHADVVKASEAQVASANAQTADPTVAGLVAPTGDGTADVMTLAMLGGMGTLDAAATDTLAQQSDLGASAPGTDEPGQAEQAEHHRRLVNLVHRVRVDLGGQMQRYESIKDILENNDHHQARQGMKAAGRDLAAEVEAYAASGKPLTPEVVAAFERRARALSKGMHRAFGGDMKQLEKTAKTLTTVKDGLLFANSILNPALGVGLTVTDELLTAWANGDKVNVLKLAVQGLSEVVTNRFPGDVTKGFKTVPGKYAAQTAADGAADLAADAAVRIAEGQGVLDAITGAIEGGLDPEAFSQRVLGSAAARRVAKMKAQQRRREQEAAGAQKEADQPTEKETPADKEVVEAPAEPTPQQEPEAPKEEKKKKNIISELNKVRKLAKHSRVVDPRHRAVMDKAFAALPVAGRPYSNAEFRAAGVVFDKHGFALNADNVDPSKLPKKKLEEIARSEAAAAKTDEASKE